MDEQSDFEPPNEANARGTRQLGLSIGPPSRGDASYTTYNTFKGSGYGPVVCQVVPNGLADRAGLKVGDVILAADGIPVSKLDGASKDLFGALTEYLKKRELIRGCILVVRRGEEEKHIQFFWRQQWPLSSDIKNVEFPRSLGSQLAIARSSTIRIYQNLEHHRIWTLQT